MSNTRLFGRALASATVGAVLLAGSPVLPTPAAAGAAPTSAPATDESTLRAGVIAIAGAISAVGQIPELSTPLPFTTRSTADLLGLDSSLAASLQQALANTDLETALDAVDGITLVEPPAGSDDSAIAFTYGQSVTTDLPLVYDDGDLRLGANDGAGAVTVTLTTVPTSPFVVEIDPAQTEELLRVALVGRPVFDVSVDIDTDDLPPFSARQGFTDIDVTGGQYRIGRTQRITMRDPDGRDLLTLEDLRYSTLPDLFQVTTTADDVDVELDVALPDSLKGGDPADRTGVLGLETDPSTDTVWPLVDTDPAYGAKLRQATGLSMVDGLTSLAQYTGTVLALQEAADVPFPHLRGGTSDLFSPGDDLLALLATAASAQVTCGASPDNPPTGIAAPGEAVYCQATTAEGLGALTGISWSLKDAGTIGATPPDAAIGQAPTDVVKVLDSDGEPDLEVTFTAGDQQLTARSMPRTVQDVVARIAELDGSTASATLTDKRLDVAVAIEQGAKPTSLELGNPDSLGALVGLTGLRAPAPPVQDPPLPAPDPATASVTARGATFDVGFGIQTGKLADGVARETSLLPADRSLLRIEDVSAAMGPDELAKLADLDARIGFLEVSVDLTGLTVGRDSARPDGSTPAVELIRVVDDGADVTDPLLISDLLEPESGALDPDQLELASQVVSSIAFEATEQPLAGTTYASGTSGPASGSASISWNVDGKPSVSFLGDYDELRVFDPVPAAFLDGRTYVEPRPGTAGDEVRIDVTTLPTGTTTLYDALNVAPSADRVEVARRLVSDGFACQNVTVIDEDTLTCEELAFDDDDAPVEADQTVQLIVLGDPFALRNSVIDGLTTTLTEFDQLDSDNTTVGQPGDLTFDQYTSSLPLVDLLPAQLAVERGALREGLAAIAQAATEDERGNAGGTPVSSAQELSRAVGSLIGVAEEPGVDYRPTLAFTLDTDSLGVELAAQAPIGSSIDAALRFDDVGSAAEPGRGQVLSAAAAPGEDQQQQAVQVTSETTLAIDVDRETARSVLDEKTSTASEATMTLGKPELDGHPLQAGVAALTVDAPSTGSLGVGVDTTYDGGVLATSRRNLLSSGTDGFGAAADLTIEDGTTITYQADATASSGGQGAVAKAPDPMQVQFLAEGLDGLSTALGSAMDGAAPRNLDPTTGFPVSAPLIGTDLDAGAGVAGILTDLTSSLRDELLTAPVQNAPKAADLSSQLRTAVTAAVAGVDELEGITPGAVTVEVTCPGGACAGGANDSPTRWNDVSVSLTLTSKKKDDGRAQFQTGLAGLEVRSLDEVETTTLWTLPITLKLTRGVGPQIVVRPADQLDLDVTATLPDDGIRAVVGYLPATLEAAGAGGGDVATRVVVDPAPQTYDLFDLYDGGLKATPGFEASPGAGPEKGLSLDFATITDVPGKDLGTLDLSGNIDIPWDPTNPADKRFGDVTYNQVGLDVGPVATAIGKQFAVIDPYLAPVRDVIDVLRTRIPVVSDLSELGGGGEVSLLSLLGTLSEATEKPQLELAYRVINLVGGVATVIGGLAELSAGTVELENLAEAGAVLTVDPRDVSLYDSCTETVTTYPTTTAPDGTTTTTPQKKAPQPCPGAGDLSADENAAGAAGQTTGDNRKGKRNVAERVDTTTKSVTGQLPGFSLPFLADPDQIMDMLTGEGEASFFRLDLGTLVAQVSYNQKFGPIMAGPVPISPFVGGSISVEGRLAMGFDSYPQTLAAESVAPGDTQGLLDAYVALTDDTSDIIREGFYIDDLDADGVDVPEVKIVTTLEAGAGVSIGIVTAGLKAGVTLTINVDLNDPNDDGRLRVAELRDTFVGNPECAFDVSADLEAFIAIFIDIDLFLTSLSYQFDLLRLGPYSLFTYGCPDAVPNLVERTGDNLDLVYTNNGARPSPEIPYDFEVRQFDRPGGLTNYEISGFGRVQNVQVRPGVEPGTGRDGWDVTIFKSGVTISTTGATSYFTRSRPTFQADGGAENDKISFLTGEEYDDAEVPTLVTSAFDTPVTRLTGGAGDDVLVTGDGDDGAGAFGIDGGPGNDSIETGLGDDSATGGEGNDIVGGGAGSDDLRGGVGNDRLEGGPGADRADGQDGDDSVVGGSGRDVRATLVQPRGTTFAEVEKQVRLGFDSGDVLIGGPGTDTVDGGDGSDVVVGGSADSLSNPTATTLFTTGSRTVNVLVQGPTEAAPNTYKVEKVKVLTAAVPEDAALDGLCTSGPAESGVPTTDFVTGGAEADYVIGGNGSDTLDGGSGPDELCGRSGDDQLSGDGGARSPAGESDDDVIRGGEGDDRADGGPGDDVMFGDDVVLQRNGVRVLDGSLGQGATGSGDDYLDGGEGDDVLAGGAGSDLLLGSDGDDATYGEGRDTAERGNTPPPEGERLIDCNPTTRVVAGLVDLNSDLLGSAGSADVTADTGRLAGLSVTGGVVGASGSSATFEGLLDGEFVVIDGRVDLDRNGTVDAQDTGMIDLPSMLETGANADGDCLLAGDGNDEVRGGVGSDYLGGDDGTDLLVGGDGNDLALGDDGVDVLLGGPDSDVLVGGLGDDHLLGGDGEDRLRGSEGADDLVGGNDVSGAADGQDVLLGGRGDDVLAAENAAAVSEEIVAAVTDPAVPWRTAGLVPETVTATAGSSDLVFPDSALLCGPAPTTRYLTLLADDGVAGQAEGSPGTPLAYDELYGGYDCDFVFGSLGDDLVRGGQDDDVVEGGPGADTAYGDDGDDVVVGGSTVDRAVDTRVTVDRSGAAQDDLGDTLHGDGGPDGFDGDDLIAGDNALPIRVEAMTSRTGYAGPPYVIQLDDVATRTATPDSSAYGQDEIHGNAGTDRIFGQGGKDEIDGDDGDDYVEGNDGADTIRGGDDDDDLLGGSSTADGRPLGSTGDRLFLGVATPSVLAPSEVLDTADTSIDGGSGDDVLLGDNGRITRPSRFGDPIDTPATRGDGTRLRSIVLADVVVAGSTAPDDLGGGDAMLGGDGRDLIFGQLGDDSVDAGDGDDYAEGNVGDDALTGGTGEDDLVGGGSSRTGAIIALTGPLLLDRLLTPVTVATDPSAATLVDGNDVLEGGDARDVLLGDNGRVTRNGPNRSLTGGASGVHVVRQVAMADEGPGVWAGSDQLLGNGGDDDLYGQFDNTRTTRTKQQYLGTQVQGDLLDGGDGDDALVGDQGVDVPTPAAALGAVDRTVSDKRGFIEERVRPVGTLVRVVTLTQSTLGGDDLVLGSAGRDSIHAGAGRDVVNAGAGDDVVFAGDGGDALWGDTGHDRLFGGDGGDVIDIKRRTFDPVLWRLAAPSVDTDRVRRTVNGRDVLYGGAGPDGLQADQGDRGTSRRQQGDRLIDWRSTINHYQTCPSGYGRGKVWNKRSSSMISTLRQLAIATGSVGPTELAIPTREQLTVYPNSGSFRCETG